MKKRVAIIVGAVVAILALIALCVVMVAADKTVAEVEFDKVIRVTDFVPSEEVTEYEIRIEKDGSYIFHGEWEYNEEGMVTGVEVFGEDGENVFKATANGCNMYSKAIKLEKGAYTIKLTYIASTEKWVSFFEDEDMEDWEAKPDLALEYAGAKDGTVQMNYKFDVTKDVPVVGIIFVAGVLIGLLFVVILMTSATKGEDVKAKFDERQELVRGKGFKYAFFGMLFWEAALFTLEPLGITIPMTLGDASLISILIGATIYASYCIWNDGYFALNQRNGVIMTVLIIMGLFNLMLGIQSFVEGYAWVDGQLSTRSSNLFCGIMMIIVCVVMLLKKFVKDRKEA